jgi:hypothetical protein
LLLVVVGALVARVLPSVLGAEGVSDALVSGLSLPADAVGVDLEQDGASAFSQSETPA